MTTLSKEAIAVIDKFIELLKEDNTDLSDIETIVDLIEGEFEENYPEVQVTRTQIKSYLEKLL